MRILRVTHVDIRWNYCAIRFHVHGARTGIFYGYLVAIVYRRPVSVVNSFVEKVG